MLLMRRYKRPSVIVPPRIVPPIVTPHIIVARRRSGGCSNDRATSGSDRRPGQCRAGKAARSQCANSGAAEATDNAAANCAFAGRVAADKRQRSRQKNGQNQALFQGKLGRRTRSSMIPMFDMIDVPALPTILAATRSDQRLSCPLDPLILRSGIHRLNGIGRRQSVDFQMLLHA